MKRKPPGENLVDAPPEFRPHQVPMRGELGSRHQLNFRVGAVVSGWDFPAQAVIRELPRQQLIRDNRRGKGIRGEIDERLSSMLFGRRIGAGKPVAGWTMSRLLQSPGVSEIDQENAIAYQNDVRRFDVAMHQARLAVNLRQAVSEPAIDLKALCRMRP